MKFMIYQQYLLQEQGAWGRQSRFDVEIKQIVYLFNIQYMKYPILQFGAGKEVDKLSSICFLIEQTPLKTNSCSEEQNMLHTTKTSKAVSFTVILYEHC